MNPKQFEKNIRYRVSQSAKEFICQKIKIKSKENTKKKKRKGEAEANIII